VSEPPRHRFESVATERSFEVVLRLIRTAIESGALRPGEKLPAEPDLAGEFGVSRTVLREALKSLELSGYLEIRRGYGGGTFVAEHGDEEATMVRPPAIPALALTERQVADARRTVEPIAARLAAEVRADLTSTRDLVQQLATETRPARQLAAAVEFHVAVARASGNPVFATVVESLRPAMSMAMNRAVGNERWRERCRTDHEHIVAEIATGLPERAERAMRRHLRWELGASTRAVAMSAGA
jgi:GntR family transcriptional regulator, transcriptional repressor for pyruvate dehydrogenase complex